jgi:hypothetical protein
MQHKRIIVVLTSIGLSLLLGGCKDKKTPVQNAKHMYSGALAEVASLAPIVQRPSSSVLSRKARFAAAKRLGEAHKLVTASLTKTQEKELEILDPRVTFHNRLDSLKIFCSPHERNRTNEEDDKQLAECVESIGALEKSLEYLHRDAIEAKLDGASYPEKLAEWATPASKARSAKLDELSKALVDDKLMKIWNDENATLEQFTEACHEWTSAAEKPDTASPPEDDYASDLHKQVAITKTMRCTGIISLSLNERAGRCLGAQTIKRALEPRATLTGQRVDEDQMPKALRPKAKAAIAGCSTY